MAITVGAWPRDLRSAVECDELVLHFQPKLDCATRELAGLEALVRWQHPRRGLIPPDEFIPIAEQYGLINLLGRRVLDLALREVAGWSGMDLAVPVAVNLSMREVLDPDLPSEVSRLLEFWQGDSRLLRLEFTESSLMVDPNRATATLRRLCDLGIQLSVDDFGTGYFIAALPATPTG